jgi:ribosomal protein L14E/L6E/L27E
LRTLSVVTLLSAVSGTVFLMHEHSADSTVAVKSSDPVAGGRFGSSALTSMALSAIPAQRTEGARQEQLRAENHAHQVLDAQAKAKAAALAKIAAKEKAAAKARAKAAAERRAKQVRQAASRSAQRDPQALGRIMAADRGWGAGQFSCLRSLWNKESGWNYRATNPSSGAYGIPQALPARKLATAGADWRTNPATQIKWGLDYIEDRYGTPCGAWGHSQSSGWY